MTAMAYADRDGTACPLLRGPGAVRIAIVGPIGSGKTVLAARLSRRRALPHVCLDELYWGPGWQPVAEHVLLESVGKAVMTDRWVAEGVHGGAVADLVWSRAQVVIWLDLPRWICVARTVVRSVRELFGRRVLWGTNTVSWRRFLGRGSVNLAALRHYPVSQADVRARLAGPTPVPVIRLSSRRAVAVCLATIDVPAGGRAR